MKVELRENQCIVSRESTDPKFYNGGGWDKSRPGDIGESRLLYHLKKTLNAMGYDLIKKRMAKDGHMVDDHQQYLRTRKPSGDPQKDICIYNPDWAIEGAEVMFNKGETTLAVEYDFFNTDKE